VDGKIGKMTYIAGEYYTVNVSAWFSRVRVSSAGACPAHAGAGRWRRRES
jgi:hypothetical protein